MYHWVPPFKIQANIFGDLKVFDKLLGKTVYI